MNKSQNIDDKKTTDPSRKVMMSYKYIGIHDDIIGVLSKRKPI